MTWKTIYIVLILFFGQLTVNAQSIANATAQYNEFVQAISSSGESINEKINKIDKPLSKLTKGPRGIWD